MTLRVELDELPACPDCKGALKFDPLLVGDTIGGLTLRGWDVCTQCGRGWHAGRRAVTHEEWRLAKGGRSVEIGTGRIRLDGAHAVEKLAARIVCLPALEELRDAVALLAADPAYAQLDPDTLERIDEILTRCPRRPVVG